MHQNWCNLATLADVWLFTGRAMHSRVGSVYVLAWFECPMRQIGAVSSAVKSRLRCRNALSGRTLSTRWLTTTMTKTTTTAAAFIANYAAGGSVSQRFEDRPRSCVAPSRPVR